MNHIGYAVALLAFCCASSCPAETHLLLPGLTYHKGNEMLAGKFVFVASNQLFGQTNRSEASVICEFDPGENKLRRLCETPSVEQFAASQHGDSYTVIYPEEKPEHSQIMKVPFDRLPTLAFVYCLDVHQGKTVRLASPPRGVAILGRHFFFRLDVFRNEIDYDERILHFDFDKETQAFLGLPGASRWEDESFDSMHTHDDNTNEVHFKYYKSGPRIAEGKDYATATFYAYDVRTGDVQTAPRGDRDPRGEFRTFDGQYVWFAGDNTPVIGNRLMKSSVRDWRVQQRADPNSTDTTLLKRFSRVGGSLYSLLGMSPDHHFAFVRERTEAPGSPAVNTYYVVNVMNGETRILFKDEVQRKTDGAISQIRWVGGAD